MQSEAFPYIYDSIQNCVISSPTGSGKTVLFELAILGLLKNLVPNEYKNVKILYIAPTKSLCTEKYQSWKQKFSNFLSVGILTSDTSILEVDEVRKSNIIITTPEKWDLLTRKWDDYVKLFDLVKLMMVDEIHMIKENRGATLEIVLTRMNTLCSSIRIVAVSATIPNVVDISEWLKTGGAQGKPAKILSFDDSYRQVEISKHILTYSSSSNNDFLLDAFYSTKVPSIIAKYSKGKAALIFCPTRNSCVKTAKKIADGLHPRLPLGDYNIQNAQLKEFLSRGVAFHHAGLSFDDRQIIEKLFIGGQVNVLCSTSTLAVGINLPAYLVVIKGTRYWSSTGSKEYSEIDIIQMIGRAGRPQFEKEGCAIIITEPKFKAKYENLINGTTPLESSLHLNLVEHLTAEVTLQTVYSVETAITWLKNTFFYVRLTKNVTHYLDIFKKVDNISNIEANLVGFLNYLIKELLDWGVIAYVEDRLVSTDYGIALSRHYILFETLKLFIKAEGDFSVESILNLLCKSAEFNEARLKHNERRFYKTINCLATLRFPFKDKQEKHTNISSTFQKISLIFQIELGGIDLSKIELFKKLQSAFFQDKMSAFKNSHRILKCMIDCFVFQRNGTALKNTLFLLRCVNGKCWEDTSMVLKQFSNIGIASVNKLIKHNVKNIDALKKTTFNQLEYFLGLRTGMGLKLKKEVDSIPELKISSESSSSITKKGEKIKMTITSEISADSSVISWHGQTLYADILSLKRSGELIDFRRIQLSKLKYPKVFSIATEIDSVNEQIEVLVSCECIAGVTKEVILSCDEVLPGSHRKLLKEDSKEIKKNDNDITVLLANYQKTQKESNPENIVNNNRKVLPNGNYECQHSCKDKAACRHLCCKEGVVVSTVKSASTTDGVEGVLDRKQKLSDQIKEITDGNHSDPLTISSSSSSSSSSLLSLYFQKDKDVAQNYKITIYEQHNPQKVLKPEEIEFLSSSSSSLNTNEVAVKDNKGVDVLTNADTACRDEAVLDPLEKSDSTSDNESGSIMSCFGSEIEWT
ncbi:related to ATP-dependent DNA helicase MER3 [Saccharomycodes ludwigii]|uniref:DNA 3'-5' helicase n=1 Tax=Saccharomycodes ludwigii TaxID=36035 RepID=A0A376B8E6_9ASCO|nr:related to ATP-dependent DNA helicase MER3 [Saccharomycodes ludwigii]